RVRAASSGRLGRWAAPSSVLRRVRRTRRSRRRSPPPSRRPPRPWRLRHVLRKLVSCVLLCRLLRRYVWSKTTSVVRTENETELTRTRHRGRRTPRLHSSCGQGGFSARVHRVRLQRRPLVRKVPGLRDIRDARRGKDGAARC